MVAPKDINPQKLNRSQKIKGFTEDTNEPIVSLGPKFETLEAPSDPSAIGSTSVSSIIDRPRLGRFVREMVTWRTPHLGYVQMYINPQSISIQDKKDISSTRTKAGFIIQYAGEALTKIAINGTTGSSGMEGINILESIYRSEQLAFEPIADALERSVTSANILALFKGTFNPGSTNDLVNNFVSQSLSEAVLDVFQQPFPTLASLAASVEMFFQGVNYKGYFESFRVEENGQTPGHFNYSIEFTAYAKQGVRRNFMPWHRQPKAPADGNGTNRLSFFMQDDNPTAREGEKINEESQAFPESGYRDSLGKTLAASQNKKDIDNSIGANGAALHDIDLRDTEFVEPELLDPDRIPDPNQP